MWLLSLSSPLSLILLLHHHDHLIIIIFTNIIIIVIIIVTISDDDDLSKSKNHTQADFAPVLPLKCVLLDENFSQSLADASVSRAV